MQFPGSGLKQQDTRVASKQLIIQKLAATNRKAAAQRLFRADYSVEPRSPQSWVLPPLSAPPPIPPETGRGGVCAMRGPQPYMARRDFLIMLGGEWSQGGDGGRDG